MATAKMGDVVTVHYTGKYTNGEVFDSSMDREPLEFKIGDGLIIKGFENGIIGMAPGEKKTVEIACKDAYGEPRPELIIKVNRSEFPKELNPETGQIIHFPQENNKEFIAIVTGVDEETVTLDANPPLAGKDLVFNLELVEIAPSSI